MVDPKFPMKVPGGPPSDACLSGSSWRCSKTGLNLSMTRHNENEWMIYNIWYDIPYKLHIWSYNVIYKSQPFVRNQGSWQLVWDLVHCLVNTAPTINHLRLLRVKLTTGILQPSIQDHKKKNIQNKPRSLDLISAIGPEQQSNDRIISRTWISLLEVSSISGHGFCLLLKFSGL